jgi:hypothetical protein
MTSIRTQVLLLSETNSGRVAQVLLLPGTLLVAIRTQALPTFMFVNFSFPAFFQ